jgi:penicillin amidase
MRAMQSDVYSPYAARVVASLSGLPLSDARARQARAVLTAWDKTAARRGPARLFFAFLRRARASIAGLDAGGTAGAWATWSLLDRMIAGGVAPALWDDPRTGARETRELRIEAALRDALDDVEREGGPDPKRWSWGRVHRLSYPHPLAAGLPALLARRLAFRAVDLPGEWHTLDVAGFRLRGDDFAVVHIPSARLVVDLGNLDASRLCLPLGQSGQILDRHAKDQLRRWAVVRDFALPFSEKAVAAATVSTLTFVPPR